MDGREYYRIIETIEKFKARKTELETEYELATHAADKANIQIRIQTTEQLIRSGERRRTELFYLRSEEQREVARKAKLIMKRNEARKRDEGGA